MILRSITLKNFRSYKSEIFTFHERFNLVSGENAQGKTNLLEAIHLLCTLRPFKQVRMEELISFGETEGRIKGELESDSGLNEVHIILTSGSPTTLPLNRYPSSRGSPTTLPLDPRSSRGYPRPQGGKTVKLNGKIVYDIPKLLGRFNVVTFLPSDLDLIKGSPQDRRRYIDALICNFKSEHLIDLKLYLRALTQRNALFLREPTRETLDAWDEKIGELGGKIVKRRIKLIERMVPLLERNYRLISGLNSRIKIQYKPSFNLGSDVAKGLKNELRARLYLDKKRRHTSVGPHRDIPGFTMDGIDASVFASQGEAKTLALALKASEIELTRLTLGRNPILLLDDITSELDERRKNFLYRLIEEYSGQIFVTATNPKEIQHKGEKKIFYVKAGRAESKIYQ
ncbi:MAG TPA: DNA replication/repair protein RecF [Thermodesulfobacteriota bacterium]|nr:DNA replication/repair protein RecF [Thermodesulfobacteriota bacterium]